MKDDCQKLNDSSIRLRELMEDLLSRCDNI